MPLLEEAAGARIAAVVGDEDPIKAARDLLSATPADEIIVSTLPQRVSHWLRRDVPSRLEAFGLPVTVVTAEQSSRASLTARGQTP